jgi:hypothetical protein
MLLNSWIGAALAVSGDGNHSSVWFENGPGKIAGFSAYGVEDHVDVSHQILKERLLVVDNFVGSELLDQIDVWCGCGRDDVGSVLSSELYNEETDASSSTMDQYTFVWLKLGMIVEALPCG